MYCCCRIWHVYRMYKVPLRGCGGLEIPRVGVASKLKKENTESVRSSEYTRAPRTQPPGKNEQYKKALGS